MSQKNLTKKFNNISLIFLYLLPLGFIFSPALINISIVIIVINYIYSLIIDKNKSLLSNKLFITLFIFWIYISLQSFFFENANSLKSLSFFRFIFLPFAIYNLLKINYEKISNLSFFYLLIVIFVMLDVFLQYMTGTDIFGYKVELINGFDIVTDDWKNKQIQRFSGPFGYELRAGTFILIFGIISFYLLNNFTNYNNFKFQNIFYLILLVSIIITGDRSPLITLFIFFIFYILFNRQHKKLYLKIFFTSIFVFTLFLVFSKTSNFRYVENAKNLIYETDKKNVEINLKDKIIRTAKDNPWSAHYLTAYEIFKSSIFFGKGVKSFRVECEKYPNIDSKFSYSRCSTHAHNIFMEIISETGLVGLLLLFTAFLIYLKKHYKTIIYSNNVVLILLFAMLLPIKPSGALFSTWFGSLIWILLGFSMVKKYK